MPPSATLPQTPPAVAGCSRTPGWTVGSSWIRTPEGRSPLDRLAAGPCWGDTARNLRDATRVRLASRAALPDGREAFNGSEMSAAAGNRERSGGGHAKRPRVFLCVPTHTTRHLAACLCGLARQRDLPEGVCVTCDGDTPDLAGCIDGAWIRASLALRKRGAPPPPLLHASRAHAGAARLNQVRNNGLRSIEAAFAPRDEDWIITLDGDSLMQEDAIETLRGVQHADVAIPYRVNLDERTTLGLTIETILDPLWTGVGSLIDAHASDELRRRQRRYERQWLARRLGLQHAGLLKGHKPKVIGGHHAVRVGAMRSVNGYDEAYEGYGYDDDDLSRRLHAVGARCTIVVDTMRAVHLWHPTRAPTRPTDAPGYATFSQRGRPAFCSLGLASPAAQARVSVRRVPDGAPDDAACAR